MPVGLLHSIGVFVSYSRGKPEILRPADAAVCLLIREVGLIILPKLFENPSGHKPNQPMPREVVPLLELELELELELDASMSKPQFAAGSPRGFQQ